MAGRVEWDNLRHPGLLSGCAYWLWPCPASMRKVLEQRPEFHEIIPWSSFGIDGGLNHEWWRTCKYAFLKKWPNWNLNELLRLCNNTYNGSLVLNQKQERNSVHAKERNKSGNCRGDFDPPWLSKRALNFITLIVAGTIVVGLGIYPFLWNFCQKLESSDFCQKVESY